MRVEIDHQLCQGHGVCVEEAPAVFELQKGGHAGEQAHVKTAEVPAAEVEAVERARQYCPTRAIRRLP